VSIRNFAALFQPRAIAVIGASRRPRSVGAVVMHNLLAAFDGPVMPVNPHSESVAGALAYPDVASLPRAPDLGVICTPAPSVPGLVRELGARGARAAIVLSAGLDRAQEQEMLLSARPHCLRILGPNCLGLLVSAAKLSASFAHVEALAGQLAFVSQSGALCTAVLDWARAAGVGFSHFVSLGNGADVDAGDLLDYLGAEPEVRAILLYLESVEHARKFLSAGRAAARNKPVLVIKAGRGSEGARAAASHTGALAGADAVWDAALRRAGMLRVAGIDELFDAAETLARGRPPRGERLAILTNGGGPGVLATDSLVARGGRMAELAPETLRRLDAELPENWSRANPVDIIGDAPGPRYAEALRALLEDPGADAVLVLNAPTAIASAEEAAKAVAEVVRAAGSRERVLASWLGRESAEPARRILREAGIPSYDTPSDAVHAFLHLVEYRRNQELLLETPPSLPRDFEPHPERARAVIRRALGEGRELLTEPESKQVLDAYGVPVVETRIAVDADDAAAKAQELGFPVALKVLSPQVTHKSDVGGVVLDLATPEAVREAARAVARRLAAFQPDARLEGYTIQRMARRPGAHELIVGAATDPVFGPYLLFGQGGTAVEVLRDRAVALPPLNLKLARDLVRGTRISRLLEGYRDHSPADLDAICMTLVRVSQLLVDLPEVAELDLNPLLADEGGVLALDARMRVEAATAADGERLAIRPYPQELEEPVVLEGGRRLLLRPIRPEDEPAHEHFFQSLEPDDVRFRFFSVVRRMPHSQMARYTQIDYDREMAFVATAPDDAGVPQTLGVVRAISDPDGTRAEFAIIVRSDLKGLGLGRALLDKMIRYCRARGIRLLVGQVLPENRRMLDLAKSLGFQHRYDREAGVEEVHLELEREPRGATGSKTRRRRTGGTP
jgi:acetyltransferase